MQHHNHRAHGSGGGSSFSVPLLAVAASMATLVILWLSDTTAHAAQRVDCNAFSSFLDRRATHAHVTQLIKQPSLGEASTAAAAAAGPGLDPTTASALGGVAADAMRRVGWKASTKYARFDSAATLEGVLERPAKHTGSFLLIVPGAGNPQRRSKGKPFLSINPAAASLPAVLGPAATALNKAVGVLEASLGRRLFSFQLESAALPPCAAGTGPCAVWEASSGRLVLDSWLAGKIAGEGGQAAAAAAGKAGGAAGSTTSPKLLDAAGIAGVTAGEAGRAATAAAEDEGLGPDDEEASHPVPAGDASGSGSGGSSSGDLPNLLAAFVDLLVGQVAEASSLLQKGKASLPALAAIFGKAGAASVTLLMAAQVPLWWCIVCPLVLGMLAPFIFNFGLTAAAEALCSQLQLPDDTCSDLWWGAFAVALMLSLASAIPIVYLCRLPECGRHGVATAAAVLGAAAARLSA
ncbi:hypothetical protein ACK3TF_001224 [Chlorella vulgaris]